MDRRFSSFILASTAFFLIYMSLRVMLIPPPVPADPETVAEVEEDLVAEKGVVESSIDPDAAAEQEKIQRPDRPVWTTLGSMDAESGHVMLVTLNSRGAGIERIELTERKENGRLKYRRVDVRSGYLGYFAADPTALENGVRINVVGPGTPADRAIPQTEGVPVGLKPGDVILSVAGKRVSTPAMLDDALIETKPGDEVIIEIERRSGQSDSGTTPAETDEASPESEGTGSEEPNSEKPPTKGTSIAPPKMLTFLVELSEHPLDLVRMADTGGEDQIPGNLRRLSALMTVGKVGRREINPGEKTILALTDPGDLIWNITEAPDQAPGKADAEIGDDSDVLADMRADGVETASFEVRLSEAEMRAAGGHAIGMRRSYSLRPGSYVLDMDLQIDNRSDQSQELAYRLEGVNGITLEGWWYSNKISPNWGGSAARDVVYKTAAEGHALVSGYGLLKRAKKDSVPDDQNLFAPDSPPPARDLRYIGIDAQYFTVAYLPEAGQETMSTFRRAIASLAVDASAIPANQERAVNTTFYLDSGVAEVPPGSSLKQSLRLFAGPKQPELFEQHGLGDCIYYGWFAWPAIALGWLLHLLSGVGNYALAIVLLTVIVRGAMFPLSRKAAVNAQRMQELAPELKKIAEKYKEDMEGRVRAQRELQQRVGFNPLSGCLPMFLQLPIFIGLYRTLSVDIELRQAAFASWTTWASNLAAPDMLAYWGDWLWGYLSGRGTGWLGPYFNILPVAVMGLFLLQQKMFMPPPTDEQSALTQKMMSYMTLIMGLFFFRVPAGLCIYFITSSLWGIGERILVKRTLPTSPHFDPAVLEGKVVDRGGNVEHGGGNRIAPKKPGDSPNGAGPVKGAVKSGGETWADRVRERLNPTEPVAPLPRDRKRPRTGKKKK